MRLSDSLHGAADKAPVDGVHVSAVEAARRVQRRRAVKASGTGLLATAGVALLAVGVVAPNLGRSADESDAAGADSAASLPESAYGDAGGTMLAAGFCGGSVDGLAYGTPSVTLDATLAGDADAGSGLASGSTLEWSTRTSALEEVHLATGRPLTYAYVLWDGVVVATYPGPDDAFTADLVLVDLDAGESRGDDGSLALTNCWDGEPLPAGDYEIVLAQEFWSNDPLAEPTLPSEPDTTAVPEESFMPEPDFTDEEAAPSEPTVEPADPEDSVSSGLAADQGFRVVTDPLTFTIAGDVVEDPFAAYLGGDEPAVVETPSDLLTPDAARSAYQKGLAGRWDMAAGTQRVVLTYDSENTDEDLWDRSWFGCTYEDGSGTSFPEDSAELDLLAVSASVPSRISTSYGWVVDGNPEIASRVTNTSEWTLPYWDGAQPRLVLVKDGQVVAESYPSSTDRDGGFAIMEDTVSGADAGEGVSSMIAPEYDDGFMGPGESDSGTFLWRDLDTCDYGAPLPAGEYTVLDQRSLYLDSGSISYGYDLPATEESWAEGAEGASTSSDGESDAMPVPDDYVVDWVELTVWTSLGTVEVAA